MTVLAHSIRVVMVLVLEQPLISRATEYTLLAMARYSCMLHICNEDALVIPLFSQVYSTIVR